MTQSYLHFQKDIDSIHPRNQSVGTTDAHSCGKLQGFVSFEELTATILTVFLMRTKSYFLLLFIAF